MRKVAVVGVIHESGIEVLKNANYHVFEITDFSRDNLKKNFLMLMLLLLERLLLMKIFLKNVLI